MPLIPETVTRLRNIPPRIKTTVRMIKSTGSELRKSRGLVSRSPFRTLIFRYKPKCSGDELKGGVSPSERPVCTLDDSSELGPEEL